MEPRHDWSLGVGRWFGVSVRIHLFFLLFVLLIGCLEWVYSGRTPSMAGTSIVYAIALLSGVLIHTLAKLWSNLSLGGSVNSVSLTPWGGFSEAIEPNNFRDRLVINGAGIFANLSVFLIGSVILLQTGRVDLNDLTYTLRPPILNSFDALLSSAVIFVWSNFQIAMFNLIPSYPFDFAQIMRLIFSRVHNETLDLKIESTVKAIGQLCGAVLIGIGILQRHHLGTPIEPLWGLFVGGGIVIFFAARYDFRCKVRELYGSLENVDPSLNSPPLLDGLLENSSGFDFLVDENSYSQWLIEKQRSRDQSAKFEDLPTEQEDARRADQILEKLHRSGIDSLSAEERAVLERVSARIRRKRQVDQQVDQID